MRENIIKYKRFAFALKIANLYQSLTADRKEYVLSKQLLSSGSSIGALVREAEQAESNADFIHKLSIALKEANESGYWIDLLTKPGYLVQALGASLKLDLTELLKLLISKIKTGKANGKR